MSELYSLGLKTIEMGPVAADGDMGAVLTDVGTVYKDTCDVTQDDPTETEHYSEQSDDPFKTIVKKGKTQVKFTLVDVTPDKLVLFLGGEVTVVETKDVWNAPDVYPDLEQSLKLTSQNDVIVKIPRAKIKAKVNWKFGGTEVAKVEVTATVLKPTKAGVKSWQVVSA